MCQPTEAELTLLAEALARLLANWWHRRQAEQMKRSPQMQQPTEGQP
jgi:hypothetical protein